VSEVVTVNAVSSAVPYHGSGFAMGAPFMAICGSRHPKKRARRASRFLLLLDVRFRPPPRLKTIAQRKRDDPPSPAPTEKWRPILSRPRCGQHVMCGRRMDSNIRKKKKESASNSHSAERHRPQAANHDVFVIECLSSEMSILILEKNPR
jgi:hypothetical protein